MGYAVVLMGADFKTNRLGHIEPNGLFLQDRPLLEQAVFSYGEEPVKQKGSIQSLTLLPSNSIEDYMFTSDNPQVRVSYSGEVSGEGSATITCTSKSGKVLGTATVTIVE